MQSGPIRGRVGETAVVITCTQANPALVTLAGDEGFAGFALRLRDIGQQLGSPDRSIVAPENPSSL